MPKLQLYGSEINSIFQLLGTKENDISYSIAWALYQSKVYLRHFLELLGYKYTTEWANIQIRLQQHESGKGFTDIEIELPGRFYIIIEAKRGWTFPRKTQLIKYAHRKSFRKSLCLKKEIIVVSESTQAFAQAQFHIKNISGIPIRTISWKDLHRLIPKSIRIGMDADNRLLRQLDNYLEGITTMQKIDSNWVYVVSLGKDVFPYRNWNISYRGIVEKKHLYFHPVGGDSGGWPAEPPNYIAFRYDGILKSVHHIDKYEVITNPHRFIPEIPSEVWKPPHYLYHLGPAIKPNHTVRAGPKIVMSMRVWAMLDLLLTCKTIQDARDRSKKREEW